MTPPVSMDWLRNSELTQATVAERIEVQIKRDKTEFVNLSSQEKAIEEVFDENLVQSSIASSEIEKPHDHIQVPLDSPNMVTYENTND